MVVTSQQREPGVGKRSAEKLIFAMAKPKVKKKKFIYLFLCVGFSSPLLTLEPWEPFPAPNSKFPIDSIYANGSIACWGRTWDCILLEN